MPDRPLGIVLTAIYSAINGVLGVLIALLGFAGAGVVSGAAAGWVGLLGLAALALAVVFGAVAYGLWTRQSWAPNVTFYAYGASIALGVVAMLYDRTAGNIVLQLVGMGIAIIVILYIQRPDVVARFLDRDSGAADPKP